jgi:methoxymalonate biosynthesis protein
MSNPADTPDHRLAILGAGVMGTGIATMAVAHGVPVTLIDVSEAQLGEARSRVDHQLRHARLLGALPPDRVVATLTTNPSVAAAADATAAIEAVTESPEHKSKALAELGAVVLPGTPLISNTSGIPIDEMAGWLPRPEDLLGTHFMNPPYLIQTVEVIRGPRTSDAAMDRAAALLAALNRRAIVVRDSPGFVTSRLLHPMINDAMRIVGEGIATAADVDALMQGCLGHPTGPLRTADLIGLDNLADALSALYERTGDERAKPCAALLEKVREGNLGRKTGRGFYDYGEVLS